MTTTIELIEESTEHSMRFKRSGNNKLARFCDETAQRLRELDKPDCVWTFDEDQGMYDTGCGESWMFAEEPRIAEHSVKFCPFCSGAVKEST